MVIATISMQVMAVAALRPLSRLQQINTEQNVVKPCGFSVAFMIVSVYV